MRSALLFMFGSEEVTARDLPGLIFMSESRSWAVPARAIKPAEKIIAKRETVVRRNSL
jgi:hypothetical protein